MRRRRCATRDSLWNRPTERARRRVKSKRRASKSQSNFSWDKCAHFRCDTANLQRLIHAKHRDSLSLKCRAYEPMKRCPAARRRGQTAFAGCSARPSARLPRPTARAKPFDCVQVSLLRRPDDHRRNVRWRETNAPTIAEDQDRHLMTVGASRLEAVPAVDGRQWRRLFDEPFRRRVGQRRHENRTDRRKGLPDAGRRQGRHVRLHREILQPRIRTPIWLCH